MGLTAILTATAVGLTVAALFRLVLPGGPPFVVTALAGIVAAGLGGYLAGRLALGAGDGLSDDADASGDGTMGDGTTGDAAVITGGVGWIAWAAQVVFAAIGVLAVTLALRSATTAGLTRRRRRRPGREQSEISSKKY